MNWEAVGASAELLGAIAVLATLIYLAVQVRHSRDLLEENRKIALSQVYAERSDQRLQDIRQALGSPDLLRSYAEQFEMSEEATRRRLLMQLMEIQIDTGLFQHKLGLLEGPTLELADARIRQQWETWNENNVFIHPYVREWYDREIRDDA